MERQIKKGLKNVVNQPYFKQTNNTDDEMCGVITCLIGCKTINLGPAIIWAVSYRNLVVKLLIIPGDRRMASKSAYGVSIQINGSIILEKTTPKIHPEINMLEKITHK